MRLFALVLLAIVIVILFYRVITRKGGIWLLLGAILAAAPVAYFEYQWQTGVQEMKVAAREVIQNPDLDVHCERLIEGLVVVSEGTRDTFESENPSTAYVKHTACTALSEWIPSDKSAQTLEDAIALYDYAYGVARFREDASGRNCAALNMMRPLGQALGGTEEQVKALGDTFYSQTFRNDSANANCIYQG